MEISEEGVKSVSSPPSSSRRVSVASNHISVAAALLYLPFSNSPQYSSISSTKSFIANFLPREQQQYAFYGRVPSNLQTIGEELSRQRRTP